MIEINENEIKDISLKIKTVVIDSEGIDATAEDVVGLLSRIFDGENVSEDEINDIIGKDESSEIELCTEGELAVNREGCVEISYVENEDDEEIRTHSKIIFSPSEPGLVIMTKDGAMNAVLSFEEGKQHICTYDTPFMPIKVYVDSKVVDNRLMTDGELRLNYTLNLNDNEPQHFSVEVKIKEEPQDLLKELLS